MRFDEIWYWGLWQIADVDSVNHYYNGSYTYTSVTFIFDEGRESVRVKGLTSLQHLFDRLKTWGNRTSEAAKRGDWEYFAAHDDFVEIHGKEPKNKAHFAIPLRAWSIAAVIAIVCGLSVTAAADRLNRYFDDKKSWDDAAASNRVSAYRKYLDTHSSGRWALEANQRIQQQYDASAAHYETSRSPGFDANASGAIVNILNYAKNTQHYQVRVAFERHNEIEPNIEQHLRQEFGVPNVLSIGDSFSEYKMQLRENEIFSAITSGFKELIPEDILEFTESGLGNSTVVFLVTYKVRAGKSLYYRDADRNISIQSRPFYPGIYIDWDFEMRTPTEPNGYRFSLQSSPAKEISYTTSNYGNERETLYDRMASSAFINFRSELVKRLGIQKVEPTPVQRVRPTSESTQTAASPSDSSINDAGSSHPIVNGAFASQLGKLRITGSNRNGFSFRIDLNGSGCRGTVNGKAEWSDENTAGYGSIPNRTEYDDPNSAYYRQTCQLIFIASQESVEVRQTFGCTYLHNTVCFFEGTYKRIGR